MELPGDKPASANIGWIFWALGGVAVVAGLVVLGIRVKKNRERALEDL
jgi:cytochrome c-type biogenesis protein CcmH/NrfF